MRLLILFLAPLLLSGCLGSTRMLCDELPPQDYAPVCVGTECNWPYEYRRQPL